MNLKSITIKNFRAYQNETKIEFDQLTTIIGRNDIGKSTILEALEIFFNNQTIKIDSSDPNIHSTSKIVEITCEFTDYPAEISIDTSSPTNLKDEYLLSTDETLVIKKKFDCGKKTPSVDIFIIANHPTEKEVSNLLELKEKDLQAIIKSKSLDSKLKGNPTMRKAIWESISELKLQTIEIPVSKPKEDAKRIWEQIDSYLPIFALFQSDRSSSDTDNEIQDPMKAAIATAISEVQKEINDIQQKVREKAEEIANNTHKALKEIDENLASKLDPKFNPPTPARWNGLFSIQLDTDDGIPLNKRGSGVRRMILVSFFKAEAERRLKSSSKQNIIYAIEEPETAQHPNNQKILIESFKSLANESDCQIILTTHSPGLASELPIESLRFVNIDSGNLKVSFGEDVFLKIAKTLGVTPDSRVNVLCCVEGPTDVSALCALSKAMNNKYPELPDLTNNEKVVFVLMGGSTLKHWVNHNYLKELGKPEFHLYDNDVNTYQQSIDQVNNRDDNSCGQLTQKLEIESYLHKNAIITGFDIEIEIPDQLNEDGKATPKIFAEAYSQKTGLPNTIKDTKAKKFLAERAFPNMTADMIEERDPNNEVRGWLETINELLN
ncbi:ATP-binding protein [Flavimarina sp. Hel_I_48]|uniref:ATP-binding protein n=1 Tax=Flavimarina sp. Hel_I_48 TaxID=1392488 RepID=UPI0004DF07A1|nr:ATP-binding protein [Flavimarina sp. Hel_I_48]